MLRKSLFIACMALGIAGATGQSLNRADMRAEFEKTRTAMRDDYEEFRRKALEDYADAVRRAWQSFESEAPVHAPIEKPVPPVIYDRKKDQEKEKELGKDREEPVVVIDDQKGREEPRPIRRNKLKIDSVHVPVFPPVVVQPQPLQPVRPVISPKTPEVGVTFHGTDVRVKFDNRDLPRLSGIDANAVADFLLRLSDDRFDVLLAECLRVRKEMNLCDWAYLTLLNSLAKEIYGDSNESEMLTALLYMESGYKMRLASDDRKIYMLFASEHVIFEKDSYWIDNQRYYALSSTPGRLNVSHASFPKEKSINLFISKPQGFESDMSEKRTIASKHYPQMKVDVAVNNNLIDFYDSYPSSMLGYDQLTRWAIHANTPLDAESKSDLYPQLRELLGGMTKKEAANRLLNLIQTGFVYEYDDKVWGHDRAFFSEETLFYPYCDCEDRSILLTRLVRDLLGLDCLLVYYPGHLAAAIDFGDEQVGGDFLELNGKNYVIADPTYINAPLGKTMPGMDNAGAKVILLD